MNEIEGQIPSMSGLATKSALTAIENKIPDVITEKFSEIAKKRADHKLTDDDKYITTPEGDKFAAEGFDAGLTQANFVRNPNFDNKLKSLNKKINSNKTKHLFLENEFKKLQTFDSVYFRGQSYFEEDGTQNYLYFNQCTDILKGLLILMIFYHGNLKDCLTKVLSLLLQLIIALIQN